MCLRFPTEKKRIYELEKSDNMRFELKAYTIWEQGMRENQEDSIFPAHGKAKDSDRLFVLCDGMGGHSAGEVASRTVCEAMSASVFTHCPDAEGVFSDADFQRALGDALDSLDSKDNGAEKKMGTTLVFLKLHAGGCTMAHIGDSRIYHIRPGKGVEDTEILFQTEDHSLVNDLVKIGELTPEEAKHSRQKNVITRAMQPNMERRPKADIHHTCDIRPGDYFMLCSDGMLEQMEDDNLKYIFSAKGGDSLNKVDMLVKVTAHNRDNHSAILVHVTDVDGLEIPEKRDVKPPEFLKADVEEKPVGEKKRMADMAIKKKPFRRWWIIVLIVIALGVLGGYAVSQGWFLKGGKDTEQVAPRWEAVKPQRPVGQSEGQSDGLREDAPVLNTVGTNLPLPDKGDLDGEQIPESDEQIISDRLNSR